MSFRFEKAWVMSPQTFVTFGEGDAEDRLAKACVRVCREDPERSLIGFVDVELFHRRADRFGFVPRTFEEPILLHFGALRIADGQSFPSSDFPSSFREALAERVHDMWRKATFVDGFPIGVEWSRPD